MIKDDLIIELFSDYLSKETTLKEEKNSKEEKQKSEKKEKSKNYDSLIETDSYIRFDISKQKSKNIIEDLQLQNPPENFNNLNSKEKADVIMNQWIGRMSTVADLLLPLKLGGLSKLNSFQTSEMLKMIFVTTLKSEYYSLEKSLYISTFKLEKDDKLKKEFGQEFITKFEFK
jgi:hypothetical protein